MGSKSKIYEGNKYKFQIGEYISHGGNGEVFNAINIDPTIKQDQVVKFFKIKKRKKPSEFEEERFKRFINEIAVLNSKCNNIKGIVKITDYYIPKKLSTIYHNNGWYLMPKLEEYKYLEDKDINSILTKMLDLADTIQILHNKGLAHRDIKPSNILINNGKFVLVDFGLIWQEGTIGFTLDNERIGPISILPPEMEGDINYPKKNIDYRMSDIYLFAKVLWMFLKKDIYGFRGMYNRKIETIYIDKDKLNVPTLEPIHLLLEGATKNDPIKRISLDEIINLLTKQKEIIEGNISTTEIKNFAFFENSKKNIQLLTVDEYNYTDSKIIVSYINSIIDVSNIFFRNIENKEYIIPLTINSLELRIDKLIFIDGKIFNQFNVKILLKINKLNIVSETFKTTAFLGDINENESEYSNIEEINPNQFYWEVNKKNYYIPSTFQLHFN
ncbi:MAG: hypothetical protein EOL97_07770 [Spirochaetia bacterium]|nr:hypothetical protein [Spirochaetia bacterium]